MYGNRIKRGVRCFILDEKNPTQCETYTRTYEELVSKKVSRPIFDYLTSKVPATVDASIPLIGKAIVITAAVIVLMILFAKLF